MCLGGEIISLQFLSIYSASPSPSPSPSISISISLVVSLVDVVTWGEQWRENIINISYWSQSAEERAGGRGAGRGGGNEGGRSIKPAQITF